MAQVQARLEKVLFSGQIRGRSDDRLVDVWGGLPDETVTMRITGKKKRVLQGVVESVEAGSSWRRAPQEAHYLSCSPWQVLAEEQEPIWKRELVRELFERDHHVPLPEFDVVSGAMYGYRNKLEFSFLETAEGLSLAFFQRGSHRWKIPADGCVLGSPEINETARRLLDLLQQAEVSADRLKSIIVRSSRSGQVAASLYVTQDIPDLMAGVKEYPQLAGMRVFYSDPRTPAAAAGELLQETGDSLLEETVLGHPLVYSDRSFFQVNVPLFEQALLDIQRFVLPDRPLYDLYSGVGTIGIGIGARNVVFVESDEESVRLLHENCRRSGLEQPQILSDRAEKVIDELPDEAVVILDPPRAGIHPRVIKSLMQSKPQRIIYLSCNPKTQVQDLTILREHYDLSFFRAYNFFPRTPHVETLAVLDRKGAERAITTGK